MRNGLIALAFVTAASFGATTAQAESEEIGARLYMEFCASCHGTSGRGQGPVAAFLTVPPTDLTQISANNDGVFPMLTVIHLIDGRTEYAVHGGTMPVWGSAFMDYAEPRIGTYASAIETRGRIMSLALYLASIQE